MQEDKKNEKYILPNDHKYLTFLKKVFRHEFRKNSFRRISTPYFVQKSDLEKIFKDKLDKYVYEADISWNKDYCLKNHPSISNLLAYVNNNLKENIQPVYIYYMDIFFPKDNCNLNWEMIFGGDVIWVDDPIIDAQLIYLTYLVFEKIWLKDKFELRLNSIWNKKEQTKFFEALSDFYEWKKHLLTQESLKNLENNNLLELLKPKNEDEEILLSSAPKIKKYLKKDSKKHFEKLKEYLELLEIPYLEDENLFWDFDFITNTVWQFEKKDDKEVVSKGFRYNDLSIKLWEQKEIPGSWFWVYVEKIIDILKETWIKIKNKDKLDLFFVQLWDDAKKVVLPLSLKAREAWINTATSLWTPSMKEQMLKATRSKARFIVMVWFMEAKSWVFQLRDSLDWTQREIKKEELIDYVVEKIGKDKLDFYEPSRDLILDKKNDED